MIYTRVTWAVTRENFTLDAECRAKAEELGGTTNGSVIALEPNYIVRGGWADGWGGVGGCNSLFPSLALYHINLFSFKF